MPQCYLLNILLPSCELIARLKLVLYCTVLYCTVLCRYLARWTVAAPTFHSLC